MEKKNKVLNIMFGIYAAAIIIQNILATKQIDITIFTVTTGILVSPIVFIISCIINTIGDTNIPVVTVNIVISICFVANIF